MKLEAIAQIFTEAFVYIFNIRGFRQSSNILQILAKNLKNEKYREKLIYYINIIYYNYYKGFWNWGIDRRTRLSWSRCSLPSSFKSR